MSSSFKVSTTGFDWRLAKVRHERHAESRSKFCVDASPEQVEGLDQSVDSLAGVPRAAGAQASSCAHILPG